MQIILYPALVQGEQAPDSIVTGIHTLAKAGVDVMIVGRGGGSIEDLWAFNDRRVAQAIFDCPVPIISAVGHETDFTIADFVSDLRAPTPSAAAELAVDERARIEERLEEYQAALWRGMSGKCSLYRMRTEKYMALLKAASPEGKLRQNQMYILRLEENLQEAMKRVLTDKRHAFALYTERLKGLSPLDKLNQGFCIVTDRFGKNVSDVDAVSEGELLSIQLRNGVVEACAVRTERIQWQ